MMIRKGGSVVGSLWRFFVATFQSRNHHPASPRRSRTTTTCIGTIFPRRFHCTVNRRNLFTHRGVHLRRVRLVYSDPSLWTSLNPILTLVLTRTSMTLIHHLLTITIYAQTCCTDATWSEDEFIQLPLVSPDPNPYQPYWPPFLIVAHLTIGTLPIRSCSYM